MIDGWGMGLGVGLALGLRHALDADHLVAVTSILSRGGSGRAAVAVGFWWGAGHAVTLVAVGGLVLATGWHFPEAWQKWLEAAVGVVIVVLGLGVLSRYWLRRIHWHQHEHADGAGLRVPTRSGWAKQELGASVPCSPRLSL